VSLNEKTYNFVILHLCRLQYKQISGCIKNRIETRDSNAHPALCRTDT